MDAWNLTEVDRARQEAGELYAEFLRVDAMSAGLYVLDAGAADPQSPHEQDEIYHVLAGSGRFTSGGEERAVEPGDVLYVPAREEHRFHSIAERLVLLVVFAPAEREG